MSADNVGFLHKQPLGFAHFRNARFGYREWSLCWVTVLTVCDIELRTEKLFPEGIEANPRTIGEHITKVRFEKRMEQSELAKLRGVHYSTLRNWEETDIRR